MNSIKAASYSEWLVVNAQLGDIDEKIRQALSEDDQKALEQMWDRYEHSDCESHRLADDADSGVYSGGDADGVAIAIGLRQRQPLRAFVEVGGALPALLAR